ncbi:FUSC family protein, partial [Achromobacter spanius]|uniref:FUSC family protein n=1 Tax=Achromobacter spanius TaxID=217203 RepID=UPI00320B909C
GPSPRLARLAAQLQACTPLTNAALSLARTGRVLPADCARGMNRLADRVENDAEPDARDDIAALRAADMPALADALEQAQPLLDGTRSSEADAFAALQPARPRTPWRVLARTYRPGPTTVRYLVRLALCLVAAEAVALATALPRSYWVPLIVVVIFKPNFGSVFARALQSCAGSVVGVGISATVLALDRGGIASLLTVAALAALLPWSIRRNYGLFSAILLPILMLLIGALQPGSWPIALARLVDVGVAAAIVLLVGYLPWIRIERNNLDHAVSAAMTTLAAYLNTIFQADPANRHDLRARAYARLSDLRIALQRGLSEPRLVSRRALAWWPVEVALERVANAISDTAWSIPAGQAAPAAAQVAQLAGALDGLAQAIDRGAPVQADAIAAPAPALQDVAAEIESLRAVLAGPDFTAAPGRAAATSTHHQV